MIDIEKIGTSPDDLRQAIVNLRNDFDAHNHDGTSSKKFETLQAETISARTVLVKKTSFSDTVSGIWMSIVNNLVKFFVGSSSNYVKFDGTNLDITGVRYIENYTAGENISSGDVVCIKPSYTDYYASDDAYTWSKIGQQDNNFSTEAYVYCDQSNDVQRGFFKWDESTWPVATNIIKAELILTLYSSGAADLNIARVSSADWDESTLTWNNQPTTTSDILSQNFSQESSITGSGSLTKITVDITHLVRKWKNGAINNYGITLIDDTTNPVRVYSSEETVESRRPTIRIYTTTAASPTIYKAVDSDYLLCRSIVGVALEAITSGNSGRVQTAGQVALSSTGGSKVYLSSTAGIITESTINANRVIMLGKSTSSSKILLNIQEQDKFIEKPYSSNLALECNGSGNAAKILAPDDARYMKIVTSSGSNTLFVEYTLKRASLEQNSITLFYDGTTTWTFSWSASTGLVTLYSNSTARLQNFFFYT